MKIGFSLNKKKKKGVIPASVGGFIADEKKEEDKQFVVGFSAKGGLKPVIEETKPSAFVIPLIQQNKWNNADEEAANAILDDIRVSDQQEIKDGSRKIVIPMVDESLEKKRSELFAHIKDEAVKEQPILAQNQIPGLDKIDNDADKFKHDIAHRPVELSVESDSYAKIPVSGFGEAMLRGMGWSGETSLSETLKDPKPRIYRLGLGATPRPPSDDEEDDNGKKKKKKRKHRDRYDKDHKHRKHSRR